MTPRRLAVPLLAALAVVATAAGAAPLTVAVTLAPQAYVAKRLAPPGTAVVTMIPPGSSEETFEPSPSQIAALQAARIYFRVGHTGLPFEARYVDPFLGAHPDVRVVTLSDGVDLLPIDADSSGDGASDPHLWMSPAILLRGAVRLAAALDAFDPAGAPSTRARLEALERDVALVLGPLHDAAARTPGAAFVAYHPTYGYLARDFGLRQIGVEIEGKELGLASLVRLTLTARADRARVLFVPPGPLEKNGRVLAESIGTHLVTVDPLSEAWLDALQTIVAALAAPGALRGPDATFLAASGSASR